MVNHIQTLLANVSSEDAKKLGLSFTVDKSFVPKKLPSRLNQARLDLVGSNTASAISAAMRVISRLDLVKYLDAYDTRIDTTNNDSTVPVVLRGESVDFSRFVSHDNVNYLFSKTWNTKVDSLLSDLYNTFKNDVDGYNGVAALIIALVVRLDVSVG